MKFPWTKAIEQVHEVQQRLQLVVAEKQTLAAKLMVTTKELEAGRQDHEMQLKANMTQFQTMLQNFSTQIFPNFTPVKQQKAYQTSPDLFAVVSCIAEAAADIPFRPELKSGEDVSDDDKIWVFLDSLSLEQRIQCYTYLLIYGECFGYKETVDFGVNAGLQSLRILHPMNVDVIVTETFPIEVVGYTYWDNLRGDRIEILLKDMMFVKTFNPDIDILKRFRGLAPVSVLQKIIDREKSGIDISIAQLQNGGLPGIVFDKTPGTSTETVGLRKDGFGRFLGNKSNKNAPYFAGGELGYISIGSSVADMDLIKLSAENRDLICNVYKVSSTDFNNKSASTESNVKTHSKAFFTKGVLPWVRLLRDGLNRQVLIDIKTKSKLKEDISDITELQPDYKSIADGLAAMPFIVPNDAIEKTGGKRRKESFMDEVWAKSGYALAEEAGMAITDVQNVGGDYGGAAAGSSASIVPMGRTAAK